MTRRTVVIVEDEALIALDLQYQCEDLGYHVLDVAASEAQAHERFAGLEPDVLLTDMDLAGASNGVDVAVRIQKSCPGIAVIFITATTCPRKLERIRAIDPYRVLRKPIRTAELSAALPD
ncbi:response regulator [Roseivivax marinus]|uniref:response regulator n=1 Tax=Roseivivax marinus TaxID=1379903 RepID=UPI00273EAA5E|nr:response regulator [Roseivivax marinus]